jgi:predicted esterase
LLRTSMMELRGHLSNLSAFRSALSSLFLLVVVSLSSEVAVAELRGDDLRSARERAESAQKTGDYRSAVQFYDTWISAVPSDTSSYPRFALALVRNGNPERAMEILRQGVSRGCADTGYLQAEAAFTPLRSMKGWRELVQEAQSNADRNTIFPAYLCVQERYGRYRVYVPPVETFAVGPGNVPGRPDAGVNGVRPDSLRRLHPVLLLHGNGQTPELMLRWAKSLQMADVAFICPEAPYTKVRESIADHTLRLSAAPDDIAAPSEMRAKVMEASADWYFAAFEEARRNLPLYDEKPIVMGFSQGGYYASMVATRHADKVRSLVMLSASYYPEAQLEVHAEKLRRHEVDILHTHGRNDPTVPFATAERIESMLASAQTRHVFVPYDGEHWMSAEIDTIVRTWLRDHFARQGQ